MTDIPGSYALTRFNATSHGILARYTVLPWESGEEYGQLLAALAREHDPHGPTEEHLVEEIAGVIWRKRRLRMAEGAAHRRQLERTFSPFSDTAKAALAHLGHTGQGEHVSQAIRASDAETKDEIVGVDEIQAMTTRARELLLADGKGAYRAALDELHEETREWWEETLANIADSREREDDSYAPDAGSLQRFLEEDVIPWLAQSRTQLASRTLVREQAFGESLDANQLERLGRYEVHLDRKLERMLAMLFKLKELSRPQADEV